ncbi:serine/threonine protein kinase, partial [Streptomyces sp. DSM 41524]|nr:serine/threonine protein kinase [Streptomyces sp. DSM 41524]
AKPHTGENAAQVIYQHLNTDVPAPSAAVPGLPVALDSLVASATARNPEVRPHDAVLLLAEAREARAQLSDAELDAVPPQALSDTHDGAQDRTSVIPRALPADGSGDGVHRTSRLEMPPPVAPPRRRAGPRGPFGGPHRKLITVIAAVLLTLGVGAGVWYI